MGVCVGVSTCVISQNHRHSCRVLNSSSRWESEWCQVLITWTKVFVQGAGVIPNEAPALVQIAANWLNVKES